MCFFIWNFSQHLPLAAIVMVEGRRLWQPFWLYSINMLNKALVMMSLNAVTVRLFFSVLMTNICNQCKQWNWILVRILTIQWLYVLFFVHNCEERWDGQANISSKVVHLLVHWFRCDYCMIMGLDVLLDWWVGERSRILSKASKPWDTAQTGAGGVICKIHFCPMDVILLSLACEAMELCTDIVVLVF